MGCFTTVDSPPIWEVKPNQLIKWVRKKEVLKNQSQPEKVIKEKEINHAN